jgi:hypothetical protein
MIQEFRDKTQCRLSSVLRSLLPPDSGSKQRKVTTFLSPGCALCSRDLSLSWHHFENLKFGMM